MKTTNHHPPTNHSALRTLHSALCALLSALATPHPALAAVPLRWTVETTRATPASFEAYQGETLDLEAVLQTAGKPLAIGGDAALYWQTNGMESVYWSAPATVTGNVMRATWTPACDVGARTYNCYIGVAGSIYHAAFQLRLRSSPGATPNALPLPQQTIDFSRVTVLNPPWPTNAVGAVESVNGRTGAVTLDAADVGARDMTNLTYMADELVWTGWPDLEVPYTGPWYESGVEFNQSYGQYVLVFTNDADCAAIAVRSDWGDPPYWQTEGEAKSATNAFVRIGMGYFPIRRESRHIFDRIALVSGVTNIAESVFADSVGPLASRVTAAESTVSAWEHYWDGDDVRFTVTNYYGSADDPALYIEQRMEPDGTHTGNWFKTVWDERTRLAPITNRLTQAEAAIATLDAAKADNGTWGYYDSHNGTIAPEGFVSISAGGVILGNGQSWQKTLVAEGCEVWTLVGSATIVPGTNSTLRLEDTDGTTVFEVVKGGRITRGATAAAAIVAGNAVTITYTLSDATENPTIQYCTNLTTHEWQTLSAATTTTPHVAWSNDGDTYTATVTLPSPLPERMFFKASYEAGEDGYVKFNSPVDATPGLYVRQGNTRVKIVPVLSGTTSGSTVTWKVE